MSTTNPQTSPQPDTNSRTPSPAPPAPIPTLPGPRASALQQLYREATTHILRTISYSNFSSCFPTPAREVPGSLRLLHEQFSAKLGEGMGREFEGILEEREVVRGLNALDGLVEEARGRKKGCAEVGVGGGKGEVNPHTLPPQSLYQAHLAPSLRTYAAELASKQEAAQEANIELLARVQQQRREIETLVRGVETVVRDLNGCVDALRTGIDEEELRGVIRGVEQGMR